MTTRTTRQGLLALALLLASGAQARAQTDAELATRQDLITQAVDQSRQGRHDEALALGKRAATIRMTPSLRMFIAQEEAALGRIADAYGNGRQCAVEAEADAQLHDRERILAACRALEESLGKRVGRVTVKLPTPAPADVRVTFSGEEVNPALMGTPYVVSPGKLSVAITAPGYLPFATAVDIVEGGTAYVDVQLAIDPNAQPCPEGQERVDGACVTKRPATPAAPPPESTSSRLLVPLVLGGAGVVVGVIGTIFYVDGDSQYATLKTQCNASPGCTPAVHDSGISAIKRDEALGIGGWVAGGALLASGAAWYALGTPKETPTSATTSARLVVNPVARSVGVVGSF